MCTQTAYGLVRLPPAAAGLPSFEALASQRLELEPERVLERMWTVLLLAEDVLPLVHHQLTRTALATLSLLWALLEWATSSAEVLLI